MTIKVLMIGPGEGVVGGIKSVADTIVPVLKHQTELLYIPTTQGRLHRIEAGKISRQNIASVASQYQRFVISLRQFRPQVIHLHTSQRNGWLKDTFFIHVAKAFRYPIIVHVHAADFDQLYQSRPGPEQHYTRIVMRRANAVVTVSEQWRQRLANIVPVERIFTFRNCIGIDNIEPGYSQLSGNKTKALFLGSIGPRKGVFDLIEAMSHLKKTKRSVSLSIAGYEERAGELDRARFRLEELNLRDTCRFVGTVQGERKKQLLSESSVFVLPSYNEGLPIALLEAMAAGLAVVTTPVGGIPEVIKDGYNGFLVTPGDVGTLVEKLDLLFNDQGLCLVMGQRNRQIAEQELDVKPYVKRLVALYESLTNELSPV